jgi:hypothetical protein
VPLGSASGVRVGGRPQQGNRAPCGCAGWGREVGAGGCWGEGPPPGGKDEAPGAATRRWWARPRQTAGSCGGGRRNPNPLIPCKKL